MSNRPKTFYDRKKYKYKGNSPKSKEAQDNFNKYNLKDSEKKQNK